MTDSITLKLPRPDGTAEPHTMGPAREFPAPAAAFAQRDVYAAPHVVAAPLGEYTPGIEPPVDWEATIAFRRHLWRYGIGVAEAMDTSERGPGGLTWEQTQDLIRRSSEAATEAGGEIVCGAGTDQLDVTSPTLDDIADAYLEQLDFIQGLGRGAVLRASHVLARVASGPQDYAYVYDKVLERVETPALIHWIGEVFDPALRGYWGHVDVDEALKAVVTLAERHSERLRGFKFSLLDVEREERLRRELPDGVLVFTGDDHDYPKLIRGDGEHHSHGLLGVLDPLAPIASVAFQKLDAGDADGFTANMESTLTLARRLFEHPAGEYKTGVVFLAYLSGHQNHFRMVTGREGLRSVNHLTDVFRQADALGLLPDPALAAERMRAVLTVAGWDAAR
ncbi:DUF993 family protein [Amycolatopsis sp. FDAARGOS 1241]|uniref:DUF993 family protein n=1 Tax=Amycolatopsis sp. FDAARGOS 1241 TaxID=2778070 RepID=UPI001950F559|nr:DUF993 family protein [Amycolatopsis sp. FDAARGOS 1241]QRP43054.1 DUF993 family protein [Amycolatopsis sp. FDAARGOS 1241]